MLLPSLLAGCLSTPDDDLSDRVAALETTVTELRTENESLSAELATLASAGASADDLAELEASLSALETSVIGLSSISGTALITTDDSWYVEDDSGCDGGHTCVGDLEQTLAALDSYLVASTATLTLVLEEGTHTVLRTLSIQHPSGARVLLAGETTDVTIDGSAVGSGAAVLEASNGGVLRMRDLTVTGGDSTDNGLSAQHNGIIELDDVEVSGFVENGIFLNAGSTLEVAPYSTITSTDNKRGIYAAYGSVVSAGYADAVDLSGNRFGLNLTFNSSASIVNGDVSNSESDGLTLSHNSAVSLSGSTVSENAAHGLDVKLNSWAYLNDVTLEDNGEDGLRLEMSGAYVTSSTFSSNADYDICALERSVLYVSNLTYDGALCVPTSYTESSDGSWMF